MRARRRERMHMCMFVSVSVSHCDANEKKKIDWNRAEPSRAEVNWAVQQIAAIPKTMVTLFGCQNRSFYCQSFVSICPHYRQLPITFHHMLRGLAVVFGELLTTNTGWVQKQHIHGSLSLILINWTTSGCVRIRIRSNSFLLGVIAKLVIFILFFLLLLLVLLCLFVFRLIQSILIEGAAEGINTSECKCLEKFQMNIWRTEKVKIEFVPNQRTT